MNTTAIVDEKEDENSYASLCDNAVTDHFSTICKSVEVGRESLRGMISFWRSFATLEENYAKGLNALSATDPAGDSFFSFKWFKKDESEDQMLYVLFNFHL